MNSYTPTIGIEVHAELQTHTKMFCSSKNDPHNTEPNVHVCPVCLAHPGTLPVINKEAVKKVLLVGIALGSKLATYTEFDRKNYFYPDIPKGYQISQYAHPLVRGGELLGVAITRVHLEEDTARSLHDQGEGSVVDFNRAGVPLMELVTEPVVHDAKTASAFAHELQLLLRTLGISGANMEKGEMRVEANISVSTTEELGTKVEIKNLNSFKSVEKAITYEIKRQTALLEKGERVIQETRGWDENRDKTFTQRAKEAANDYRYFPDPDLPKLNLTEIPEFTLSRLKEIIPELPSEKRVKYSNLGLAREQIDVLIYELELSRFFDNSLSHLDIAGNISLPKIAANYLTSDVQSLLSANTDNFIMLVSLVVDGTITSRVAKDLLPEVLFSDTCPKDLIVQRNLSQNSSKEQLISIVRLILSENEKIVAEFRNGKESSLQFLVGQGMKKTNGTANPQLLAEILRQEIN
jgi:aspartyl-tRNA(Asn)/glutamyl-tRNA(Gln) amidotransferase subunit B